MVWRPLEEYPTELIPRNTTIPMKKSQVFTTADDSQTAVDVHILQGERAMARDNVPLGNFTLTGIPPAPRGVPQVEVTFDIDANGIIHVTAKDKASGKEQGMQVTAPNKMSRDEIDKKVGDAEQFAAQDKTELELAQTKNEGETLVYTTKKTMKEFSGKVPKDIADKVDVAEGA